MSRAARSGLVHTWVVTRARAQGADSGLVRRGTIPLWSRLGDSLWPPEEVIESGVSTLAQANGYASDGDGTTTLINAAHVWEVEELLMEEEEAEKMMR